MNEEYEWDIRPPEESDISFIYSTWSKSFKKNSNIGVSCNFDIFFPEYTKVMDFILQEKDLCILIACKQDEPDEIYGYIVYNKNILHYAFVKKSLRRFGIFKSLFHEANLKDQNKVYYTHLTSLGAKVISHFQNTKYNPFILFKKG